MACLRPLHVDSPCGEIFFLSTGGAPVVYGTTEPFVQNTSLLVVRGRNRSQVLHLDRPKPCMVEIEASFTAIYSGTHFAASGFHYLNPSETFEFTNLTAVSGLLPDPSNSPIIPLTPILLNQRETVFISLTQSLDYDAVNLS